MTSETQASTLGHGSKEREDKMEEDVEKLKVARAGQALTTVLDSFAGLCQTLGLEPKHYVFILHHAMALKVVELKREVTEESLEREVERYRTALNCAVDFKKSEAKPKEEIKPKPSPRFSVN